MKTTYNETTRETVMTEGDYTVRMWGDSSDNVSAYGSHFATAHEEEIIVHGVTREEADAAAIAWLEDQPR
jgi:hypothetical protein